DEVMDAAADAQRDGASDTRGVAMDSVSDRRREVTGNAAWDARSEIAVSLDRGAYAARVERVRAYIAAGDIYQANLSMRLDAPVTASTLATYGRLRAAQPVSFGGY